MKTLDIQASYIPDEVHKEDMEKDGLICEVGQFVVNTFSEKGHPITAVMGRMELDKLIRKKLDRIMAVNIDMKSLREEA